jgi:CRISPR-associated protein Csy1
MSENRRREGFKAAINEFLRARLEEKKLAKAPADRQEDIRHKFEPAVWLEDAAKRVSQLQAVTHSLKAMHTGPERLSEEGGGRNLFCPPGTLPPTEFLGSHALPEQFPIDIVGNAAALDVYAFLSQVYEGRTLLEWLEEDDPDARAALDPDPEKAAELAAAFLSLKQQPKIMASHNRAKQVYWLTGDHPTDDGGFHLLAPLFPSALAHVVFLKITTDLFSEDAKKARKNKKDKAWDEAEVRDYPNLAIQKIGGSNPQNAGQLSSKRRGVNYLFPSLPPVWVSRPVRPPRGETLFTAFGRRPKTLRPTLALKKFLKSDPKPNLETRAKRNEYLYEIIDEFIQYAAELKSLPPGWTQAPACRLAQEEKDWLEPEFRVHEGEYEKGETTDPWSGIIQRFANWLNSALGKNKALPVGEVEQAFWADALARKEVDFDQHA